MKNSLLIFFVLLHTCLLVNAQWNVYLLGGVSPASHPKSANLIVNRSTPLESFLFNLPHVETQYFAGVNFRNDLNEKFFTTLGMVYTQRKFHYAMSFITPRTIDTNQEMMVSEHLISLPASVGARLNFIEVACGLQTNIAVTRQCGLDHIEGFDDHDPLIRLGWHSAVQFNLGKIIAGVEYQSDFARVCSGMQVNGKSIELMQVPGQVVLEIQYKL